MNRNFPATVDVVPRFTERRSDVSPRVFDCIEIASSNRGRPPAWASKDSSIRHSSATTLKRRNNNNAATNIRSTVLKKVSPAKTSLTAVTITQSFFTNATGWRKDWWRKKRPPLKKSLTLKTNHSTTRYKNDLLSPKYAFESEFITFNFKLIWIFCKIVNRSI